MARFFRVAPVLLVVACGGGSAPTTDGFTLHFQLSKGGTAGLVDCKNIPEVTAVKVRVLGADGITALPGWPKTADCETGELVDTTVPAGSYTLEVIASGDLFGTPDATLFKLRRDLVLPADHDLQIALTPEVAFLSINWSFSTTGDLGPCTDEIDTVSIFLGSGAAGAGTFTKTDLACSLGSYTVPTPLLPQNYAVKLDAYAKGTGRKLYKVDEMRVLEKGANPPYAVVFQPIGGRLLFDWQFALAGSAPITACDDPRVGVTEVVARVTSPLGDDPIEATIPCAAQRPFAMPGARFTQGTPLTLTLTGEGAQRFRGVKVLMTQPADTDLGLIPMVAVGSATVTVTRTATSACPAGVASIGVKVTPMGISTPIIDTMLPATGGTVPVLDVPLFEYDVAVEGKLASGVAACRAQAHESITGRGNRWRDIEL